MYPIIDFTSVEFILFLAPILGAMIVTLGTVLDWAAVMDFSSKLASVSEPEINTFEQQVWAIWGDEQFITPEVDPVELPESAIQWFVEILGVQFPVLVGEPPVIIRSSPIEQWKLDLEELFENGELYRYGVGSS